MASLRTTTGSLFGVVNTAATTMIGAIGTVSTGISMLEATINSSAKAQSKRIALDELSLDDRLVAEASEAEAERGIQTLQFCARSADHATLYAAAQTKYAAAIASLSK